MATYDHRILNHTLHTGIWKYLPKNHDVKPKGSPTTKKFLLHLCSTLPCKHPNSSRTQAFPTKARFKVGARIHAAAGAHGARPNGTSRRRRQERNDEAPEGHGQGFLKRRGGFAADEQMAFSREWQKIWGNGKKKTVNLVINDWGKALCGTTMSG